MPTVDITQHFALVHYIVNRCKMAKWASSGVSTKTEDLFQQGCLGLMRAADKFEPDRGTTFATYARFWIEAYVKDYCIDQIRTVRVPQKAHFNAWKAGKPHKQCTSIDTTIPSKGDNDVNYLDLMGFSSSLDDEFTDSSSRIQKLKSALSQLPKRDQTVLYGRFFQDRTLESIGDEIGVTRERTRQIEQKALRRLRMVLLNDSPQFNS